MITAGVIDFDYQHWLAVAGRYSRRSSEAADLLHDALLESVRTDQLDFSRETTKRWFAGVIRNRAAMIARTAARRARRETIATSTDRSSPQQELPSRSFIDSLSPSARRVATLIVAGLNRDEIIAALNIAPTAFRQRLTTIRRAWQKSNQLADDRDTEDLLLDLGLMRRALLGHVKRLGGVGTHDPDGHLIVLSTSQSTKRRQQKIKKE